MTDVQIIAVIVALLSILIILIDVIVKHNRLTDSYNEMRSMIIYHSGQIDGLSARMQAHEAATRQRTGDHG